MASGRIKGITIEIDGNTTKLQSALKGVDKSLRDTQSALRDVNKLLKLDPKNVTLLQQKQDLLKRAIQDTETKLKTEKEALAQLKQADQTPEVTRQMEALERQIIEDEQKLKSLNKEMKEFGSVGAQQMKAVGQQMKDVGDKMKTVGENMTKYVTLPIVAAGAGSIAAWKEVDSALDIVIAKTGATGQAADDMGDIVKDLATTIPTSFEAAGNAVGEVNTRFGVTGDELEDLSGKFIKFAELNGTDVSTSIDLVQQAMSAFGMDASQAGEMLDILNRVGQNTGISVDQLAASMVTNSAALHEMGFGASEAAQFLGEMEMAGIDSSTMMAGLKKALANAAAEGKPLDQALSEIQTAMEGASDNTEAMNMASELFGSKAGPQIAEACRNGVINFNDLGSAVEDAGGSVEDTFDATQDPLDSWQTTMNELKILGAEVGGSLGEVLLPIIQNLGEWIQKLVDWWKGLSPEMQKVILITAGVVAAIGPIIGIIGGIIGALGNIILIAPEIAFAISMMEAPLLPIIAIIAAVVAAIVAVVLIVKNWGAICEWFKGVWQNFTAVIKAVWEQVQQYLQAAWEALKTVALIVWEALKAAILTPIQTIWAIIQAVWNAIKTFLTNAWNGIKNTAQTVWNAIQNFIITPIQNAWNRVKGIIDTMKSTISSVFNGIKSTAQSVWDGIKNAITQPIETAKNTVKGIIDGIKNFFPLHIGKIFSGLKLPHFSITGGQAPFGIAGRGSLPHFSVSWYKKAYDNPYLINTPTIFQTPYGLKGFGDGNGGELVYGRNQLMRDIAAASSGETTINIYASQGMDVNALADAVQSRLVRLQKQREKAYA